MKQHLYINRKREISMKFTEGYWEKNEKANAVYAVQAFTIDKTPHGLKVICPVRTVSQRADALDISTITIEFSSIRRDVISVRAYHYEAYEKREPRFKLNEDWQEVDTFINDDYARMDSGKMSVIIRRNPFAIEYWADNKLLTTCSWRNLGYMQYDRKISTKFPENNYMSAEYEPFMLSELSLKPGECVYGLGERFTAFVKNGQVIDTWNEDGGTASQMAYKNIPFYMTNNNYGVFVDHSDNVSFEVASEKVEYVGISVKGEELRYHIIYGSTLKNILETYTDLVGKPALPPKWSFGLWLSTSFKTNYDEETTSSFIKGMEDRDLPFSVFHFDCFWMKAFHWCDFEWDENLFTDVQGMLARYKARGLKLCVWINPYMAQGTKAFEEGRQNGYFLMRADGKGIKQIDNWQPGMAIVDFTNPEAANWYISKLQALLDMGIDTFKTDFGERIPIDVTYYDGSDPVSMHNYYTYLYNKTVFEFLEKTKGKEEVALFARSATVGGQQFPIHWGGDCLASYASMAESLRGGLSLMMSGFSFWSHDIGGFELTATPDLYKRWLQFGLLSTHSRLHGSDSYRVPWLFDEESVDVCRYFTNLKLQLMPYIYSTAVTSHTTGIPSIRPMILEFEEDPAVKYLDMQYMFGDSLLVAPIFDPSGIVDYYLPRGKWTHLLSNDVQDGGTWHKERYDYFSLPLYVKEDSLLPLGQEKNRPDYDYTQNLQLHLFALQNNKSARCLIPDNKGKVVLEASATRIDNQINLESSYLPENMTYCLRNIHSIKSVIGGEYVETSLGISIIPTEKKVIIELVGD